MPKASELKQGTVKPGWQDDLVLLSYPRCKHRLGVYWFAKAWGSN